LMIDWLLNPNVSASGTRQHLGRVRRALLSLSLLGG
jgi:hypothetical protein